ncbi:MAG: GIY-YIG nuclease family protein [Verrucomicrobiae bacterium]|nr:GIY-YIG nuclease family protein [Verrucomicrobiae bacterium]
MPANPPTAWNVVFYVYLLTNKGRTTLYAGVTDDLERRMGEHRHKVHPESFTARYQLNRLVWFERFHDVRDAIAREKQIKRWRREKKEFLVSLHNPKWEDLAVVRLGFPPPPKYSDFQNDPNE